MTQVWRQAASFQREQGPGRAWMLERVRQRAHALARHDARSPVAWPDAWLDAGTSWAEVLAPDASGLAAATGLRVPPEAWPRLLRQLGQPSGQFGAPAGHVPVSGWWRAGAMRVVISLSAMLCFGLGLLLAWGALTHEPGASEPGRYMAVLSSPQEQATWVLVVEQERNLRLSPLSMLTPVRPGQQLMLWVRGASELRPQAVGPVAPDKPNTWALARLPALQGGQHIELTLESLVPGDALPRQPQGPVVAQGTLDPL
jgi:anti-sigma-K factor RskA